MEVEGVLVGQSAVVEVWKRHLLTLQIPQATVHSSLVAEA